MDKFAETAILKEFLVEDFDFSELESVHDKAIPLVLNIEGFQENINYYKNGFDNNQLAGLFEDCKHLVINSIVGPFGLSADFFDNKDGGNVTTVFNFAKGITACEDDQNRCERYEKNVEKIDRKAVDTDLAKKRDALIERNSAEGGISAYTNKPLEGAPSIEHIRPVSQTLRDPSANLALNDQKLVNTINSPENLTVIERPMNSSRQEKDLSTWAECQAPGAPNGITNKDRFDLDMEEIKKLEERSMMQYKKDVNAALFKKQATELAKTSLHDAKMMAIRRAVGLILKEFSEECFYTVRICIDRFKSNADAKVKQLFSDITTGLKRLAVRMIKRAKAIFKESALMGISAAISSIITFVINNFLTTAKNAVAIIRETFSAIIDTGKALLKKKDNERFSKAAKIMLAALATCCGILLLEAIKKVLETTPLNPFSDELGNVAVGIITGLMTILIIFLFNKIKYEIRMTDSALVAVESCVAKNEYEAYETAKFIDNAIDHSIKDLLIIEDKKERLSETTQSRRSRNKALEEKSDLESKEISDMIAKMRME